MFILMPNHVWIIISPIDAHVRYMITDPDGLRFGYDPRTKQNYTDFVGSAEMGGHGTIGKDGEPAGDPEDEFQRVIEYNMKDGTYTIEMIGTAFTPYSMSIRLYRNSELVDNTFNGLVIDKDLSIKFQFTFTSDPTKPIGTATRLATPGSLKEDIELVYKMELHPPGKEDRNVSFGIEVSSNVEQCTHGERDEHGKYILAESCSYTYTAKKSPI